MTDPDSKLCPECGVEFSKGSPGGVCPSCLAKGLLSDEGTLASLTAAVPTSPTAEESGTIIGNYRLLEEIGEGGFGIVYLAEQKEPVRRKVALKLIKPGMDSREIIARFEAERQAVAMMDHPNVAMVYDAGSTETGRPYFVMELVKGDPITDYCDRQKLPLKERLLLFMEVCRAVQHAHQKGIIHRDLKPSNVLVADHDGQPALKIIDFGVARALSPGVMNDSYLTLAGQPIGTRLYMSPEQMRGSSDTDRPSDVYSLGVILYELLTGTTPLDPERIKSVATGDMWRLVSETDIVPPSLRVQEADRVQQREIAEARKLTPQSLILRLKQDLEWVVLKALEFEPDDRYATPEALGKDLANHLDHRPVSAGPRTVSYRLRTFARRRRTLVDGAAAAVVALFAGMAITEWWQGDGPSTAGENRPGKVGEPGAASARGPGSTPEGPPPLMGVRLSRASRHSRRLSPGARLAPKVSREQAPSRLARKKRPIPCCRSSLNEALPWGSLVRHRYRAEKIVTIRTFLTRNRVSPFFPRILYPDGIYMWTDRVGHGPDFQGRLWPTPPDTSSLLHFFVHVITS